MEMRSRVLAWAAKAQAAAANAAPFALPPHFNLDKHAPRLKQSVLGYLCFISFQMLLQCRLASLSFESVPLPYIARLNANQPDKKARFLKLVASTT
jgi:hypothetical protein